MPLLSSHRYSGSLQEGRQMSRHNTFISGKNRFTYEKTYNIFCNGSWTPGPNVSLNSILSSIVLVGSGTNLDYSEDITNGGSTVQFNYTLPNNPSQSINRIVLMKREYFSNSDYRIQQVYFQAPYFIIGVNLTQPFFNFGDLLYFPPTNTIYRVNFTNGFYAVVDPPIAANNYNTIFVTNLKRGKILQTEAITPVTMAGQQLSFRWSIDNGNSPT